MNAARLIDLTHELDDHIPMFPGLPGLELSDLLDRDASRANYEGDTSFLIQRIALKGNCGTYMDAPFHRYPGGVDLAALPLESTACLPGVRIDARDATTSGRRTIDESYLNGCDVGGRAVLFWTGWDDRWPDASYLDPNPFINADLAERLVEEGAALVGIDCWNIDDTENGSRPAHSILLRGGVPIVENLRSLSALECDNFSFTAAPIPIRNGTAIPVRAFAIVER
jgi:arylformamidase